MYCVNVGVWCFCFIKYNLFSVFLSGVQEQTSIAKLGLELRLLSSGVDTEVEKWDEQEHAVVRQSQSLASMAYNMYLFTRWVVSWCLYIDTHRVYIHSSLNCSEPPSKISVNELAPSY